LRLDRLDQKAKLRTVKKLSMSKPLTPPPRSVLIFNGKSHHSDLSSIFFVGELRTYCMRFARRHVPNRDSSFIALIWNGVRLEDDALPIERLCSFDRLRDALPIYVAVRRSFRLTVNFFDLRLPFEFHERSVFADIRRDLARRYHTRMDDIRLADRGRMLNDDEYIAQAGLAQVTACRMQKFIPVFLTLPPVGQTAGTTTELVILPNNTTVPELHARVQHFMLTKTGKLFLLVLRLNGRVLGSAERLMTVCSPGTVIEVAVEKPLPTETVDFVVEFKDTRPLLHCRFPTAATVEFARVSIAIRLGICPGDLLLKIRSTPADYSAPLSAARHSGERITAEARVFTVFFRDSARIVWKRDFPRTGRVYELRNSLRIWNQHYNPFQAYLCLRGRVLDDSLGFAMVGLEHNAVVDVIWLPRQCGRIPVSDLSGKVALHAFNALDKRTFEDLAGALTDFPAEIEFRQGQVTVPRTDLLTRFFWDPDQPFEVVRRSLELTVRREPRGFADAVISITSQTKVSDVINELLKLWPDVRSLDLQCNTAVLSPKKTVLNQNPQLDPCTAVKLIPAPTVVFERRDGQGSLSIAVGQCKTVGAVREVIAQRLQTLPEAVRVYRRDKTLSDTEKLTETRYDLEIETAFTTVLLSLFPASPTPGIQPAPLQRTVQIDVRRTRTVGQLVAEYSPFPEHTDELCVDPEKELQFADHDDLVSITIAHPWPITDDLCFRWGDQPVFALPVVGTETVADVKLRILSTAGRTRALARVITLVFWTVELDDQREFRELNLPGGHRTTIEVNDAAVETIAVDGHPYEFGPSDTVGDLRRFLARERGGGIRLSEPDDGRALLEVAIRGITTVAEAAPAAPVVYQIMVNISGLPQTLKFSATPDTPVEAAEPEVKKRFACGPERAVQFQMVNEDTGEVEAISPDTPFAETERDRWFLSAQTVNAQPQILVAEPDPPEEQGGAIVSIGGGSVVMSNAPIEAVDYSFIVAGSGIAFQLRFTRGQTVLDARKAIQSRFNVEELADIGLLFGGKALRDAFVLDRLRIGTKQITVTIRDRRSVLLVTAA
jgi:hypothetical protein